MKPSSVDSLVKGESSANSKFSGTFIFNGVEKITTIPDIDVTPADIDYFECNEFYCIATSQSLANQYSNFVDFLNSVFESNNISLLAKIANASELGLGWLIFTLYFTYLLLAFFIWKIGQGKNWARITYLVLFMLGVPFTIYSYLTSEISTFSIILGIAGIILQIVALVFLFQKSSSDWFKSKKK